MFAFLCVNSSFAGLNESFSGVSLNSVTVGSGSWMVGGLPAGWTQYNGDNLAPYTALATAFGTNAWITRQLTYSDGSKDTVAVSTSYYTPAGISNDWLISPSFTPATGEWLLLDGVASNGSYADGFLVKVSTNGSTWSNFTTTLLTVTAENTTWTTHAINLSAYVGQTINIAIVNNSNDKELLYLNNVRTLVLPQNDAAVLAMTPGVASYKSYTTVGGAIPVQGLLFNYGSTPITSYTIKINDGTATTSYPQTGNIGVYASTVFSLNYNMTAAGTKPIKMWVELTGDTNASNDSTSSEFQSYTSAPPLTQVFEEGTGTWCQWCPRGAVFMDSMASVHPNTVLIAVHNSDPMTVTTYDAGMGALIGGYPSCLAGRKEEIDPSDIFTAYTDHQNDFGAGEVTIDQPTYSGNTMTVKANVKMSVNTKPNYDYRLAMVVTKDDQHGTGSTWNQANAYAGGANGAMGGFESLANPVPAASMYYDHVAMNIEGGFNGVASSLPGTMTSGTSYSYTFNWTMPTGFELAKAKVNVLLIAASNGEVQNAKWVSAYPTAVENIIDDALLSVYPNPTSDVLNIDFTLKSQSDVVISLQDITGKQVFNQTLVQKSGNQGFQINTRNMADGVYSLSLRTSNGVISKKITVKH